MLAIRLAFKAYLLESSKLIEGAYFFLLQGLSNKSLCIHTNLSVQMYAAVLLACKLVRTRMSGDDVEVRVNSDGWMDFLRRYGLNGPGSENCCEITRGSVKLSMIKESVDDDDTYGHFHALCIGYYEPGEESFLQSTRKILLNNIAMKLKKKIIWQCCT